MKLLRTAGISSAILVILSSAPLFSQTLESIAVLPADTFEPGPTSGQFIAPTNGRIPPFVNKQPVQGISSVLRLSSGDFLVMSDNGFGAQDNSQDYVLRVHRIGPDFKTKTGGSGSIALRSFVTLSDPHHRINFPIVADLANYPFTTRIVPVDAAIRQNRWLTGADFDIESVREAKDGTLWFGDEFGPFLIHTDANGVVLDAPFPLPGVRSPQNPFLNGGTPTLPRSKGFEGMAITPNGKKLYPMLEGPLTTEPDQRRLIINEFEVDAKHYTGKQWFYRLEANSGTGQSIGDFTAVSDHEFLVIERDNFEGAASGFKKIFLVDFDNVAGDGFLAKTEVADLLHLRDPFNLGGRGGFFSFPFQTIESVIVLSDNRLGVLNDNNYPFSAGRTPGQPDNNEFIIIKLDKPLAVSGKR